jgi:hypothetical protein
MHCNRASHVLQHNRPANRLHKQNAVHNHQLYLLQQHTHTGTCRSLKPTVWSCANAHFRQQCFQLLIKSRPISAHTAYCCCPGCGILSAYSASLLRILAAVLLLLLVRGCCNTFAVTCSNGITTLHAAAVDAAGTVQPIHTSRRWLLRAVVALVLRIAHMLSSCSCSTVGVYTYNCCLCAWGFGSCDGFGFWLLLLLLLLLLGVALQALLQLFHTTQPAAIVQLVVVVLKA